MIRRESCEPRANWKSIVERQGLLYHTIDGRPYWDESACYVLAGATVAAIERATDALNEMCLAAVALVLAEDRLDEFEVPPALHDWVRASWGGDDVTIYGRFDLACDGRSPPRLLEYNADTPTALLEAAVIQWFWLRDRFPHGDQFNSIHERLIEAWRRVPSVPGRRIHFAATPGSQEDFMTVAYLRETARQAGHVDAYLDVDRIGWDVRRSGFVGLEGEPIDVCFKLYPWEWLTQEPFAAFLPAARTGWLEPPWKMLLSNKALLVVLWELFPDSPYLLPASYEPLPGDHVRKPLLSREGANVQVNVGGRTIAETGGSYGDGPVVYQAYAPLPDCGGRFPIIGSWLVNGHACGVGIREDASRITGNASRFVPHRIG